MAKSTRGQQLGQFPVSVDKKTRRIRIHAPPTATLQDLQAEVLLYVAPSPGCYCPLSGRVLSHYNRKLTWDIVQFVCWLTVNYKMFPRWYYIREIEKDYPPFRGGDYGKAVFWGLAERRALTPEEAAMEDTRTSGVWKPTGRGRSFAEGILNVPKFVKLYLNQYLGHGTKMVSVTDAAHSVHSYNELMNRRPIDMGQAI